MIDTAKTAAIKKRCDRFDFGDTKDVAANMRFLLEQIAELQKIRDAAISLANQLEASTVEQDSSDYRIIKNRAGVVCRKSTFIGLRATL